MTHIFGKRLKYLRNAYVGNDVDLWEMSKIYGKWLKYLTNGLNMWEYTQRFWEMAKIFVKGLKFMRHGLSILGTAQVCCK